jgi:hypothetical protein
MSVRPVAQLEGIGQSKNPITLSEIEKLRVKLFLPSTNHDMKEVCGCLEVELLYT